MTGADREDAPRRRRRPPRPRRADPDARRDVAGRRPVRPGRPGRRRGPARAAAAGRHGLHPVPQGRGRSTRRMRHYLELPRHGYIVARVDIRGHRRLGGPRRRRVRGPSEQVDGYDAIEWIAAQPWCDGHVNMMGISYGGFTALQVATLQPPHLTSIIPVDFTDDRYTDDCHYRGGLLRMYYDLGWYGTRMIAWNAMPTDPIVASDDRARGLGATTSPRTSRTSWPGCATRSTGRTGARGRWRTSRTGSPARRSSSAAGATATRTRRSACSSGSPVRSGCSIGPWDHRYPDAAHPGSADRPPARGRPLARPLVPRASTPGSWPSRRSSVYMQEAGSLAPDRLETPGRWRAETVLAAGGRRPSAGSSASGGRPARLDARPGGRRSAPTTPRLRPDGRGRRPACGRAACRSGCPATSAATRRARWSTRRAPLDAPLTILGRARADLHVASSARGRRASRSACPTSIPTARRSSSPRACSTAPAARSLTEPEPLEPGEVVRAGDRDRRDRLAVPARPPDPRGDRRRPTGRTSGRRRSPRRSTSTAARRRPIAADPARRARRRRRHAAGLRAVAGRRPPRRGVRATGRRGPSRATR